MESLATLTNLLHVTSADGSSPESAAAGGGHRPEETPYRGPTAAAYHLDKRSIPPGAIPWLCRARADLFQPWIDPAAVVFEFGCGWGWNLGHLYCARRLGHDIASFVPPALVDLGIEYVEDPSQLASGSASVVLCHHALEHVIDPAAVLRELKRIVSDDGILILSVPYEKERRYRRFDPTDPNHHLYSWTVQTLGTLVSVTGWRVETAELRAYGDDRRAARWAVRLGWGERGFRWLRLGLRTLRPIQEIVIRAKPGPVPV